MVTVIKDQVKEDGIYVRRSDNLKLPRFKYLVTETFRLLNI